MTRPETSGPAALTTAQRELVLRIDVVLLECASLSKVGRDLEEIRCLRQLLDDLPLGLTYHPVYEPVHGATARHRADEALRSANDLVGRALTGQSVVPLADAAALRTMCAEIAAAL